MNEKTESQLITEAIGAHGLFFKKALRAALESIPKVQILGEEYPVRYLEGGSIDLLVAYTTPERVFVLPIECKRALTTRKKWIFFRDQVPELKYMYAFNGNQLIVNHKAQTELGPGSVVCIEGIEIDLYKLNGKHLTAASHDAISKAAFQACKGSLGFLAAELNNRQKPNVTPVDFALIPLVITTATLEVANLPLNGVDLQTGAHIGELETHSVSWVILNYSFTPSFEHRAQGNLQTLTEDYQNPLQRGVDGKECIVIVNAGSLEEFFRTL